MPDDAFIERMIARVTDLLTTDAGFAAAMPDGEVNAALDAPGLRLPQMFQTNVDGYSDRPALGQRAVELVTDTAGRTTTELLPRFDTVTYREMGERVGATAAALGSGEDALLRPADRVCLLGFASIDYAIVDFALMQIGAVATSLPTGAPIAQVLPIVNETEPSVIASSVEYLDDAVELAVAGHVPAAIVVFDFNEHVDDHRDALQSAITRLDGLRSAVRLLTMPELLEAGRALPPLPPYMSDEPDPLRLLVYTSGSTGSPKGAMYTERTVTYWWFGPSHDGQHSPLPMISLIFAPMSHVMARSLLYTALGAGGTAYFTAKSDLSTLLDDLALARPTMLAFVPRIWDILYEEVTREVDRRVAAGADPAAAEADVLAKYRIDVLGGRYVGVASGSAAISPEMKAWAEKLIEQPLMEGYGSTEAGTVFAGGTVRRPPVIDYKLADVPELGYFGTDRPHPRGELLVKTAGMFPGYYKRPELTAEVFDADGFYRTGDIVAETGPDQLEYLDRRNTTLKLSQGEFVAVSKLEAVYTDDPLVSQIYVYGNSSRPYLLAIVVPTDEALARAAGDSEWLKSAIGGSFQNVARAQGLQSYEIPRDFVVEHIPFSMANGLLTGVGKLARPKLKERYGAALEQLYADIAEGQSNVLRALRQGGADQPVIEVVTRAAGALLGAAHADLSPDAQFIDIGGDSLSALTFARLLYDIFGVDVPVGVIVSPASDLRSIAAYIEGERAGSTRPTFATVHGRDSTRAHAGDLTLDKFIDAETLATAAELPAPSGEIRSVLVTGATGFLGRYLALEWLERMQQVGGMVICLVRAKDDAAARARLDAIFDCGDPELLCHYRELAADHLQVLAGDKAEPNLGLDEATWQGLADSVDLIVDPAALVNHLLPYSELFGPNVAGTAELIRLAITAKIKQFAFVSTIGVIVGINPDEFTEDADMRVISPSRDVNDIYANGYGNSKWAAEVLLREANDLCGLPVTVYRCGMILADATYQGQLNVPDTFTRLILSLLATGIAPASFYQLDSRGQRQQGHYDGLPVDFIAEAISTLGAQHVDGYQTYHVMNPYDDGIGLDQYVDWLTEAGYPVHRIADYDDWFGRFETSIRGLPDRQRQASVLPLLDTYRYPGPPPRGAMASTERFQAAVQSARVGPDKDIPHISQANIVKYATSLEMLGLL
ncbi:fatty acid CoA ligase FadD9 [Mycolicibacterium sp. BK556]|uniref:carboxylic acid reductase n=1 Tax=unclassified Mycolicibacterium TaxID=2636767 RepID=UPI00162114E3|nr:MULTISPECIES: carboxylic acid reductase [unclassified Mycolicibacterium]MBB3600408.1 fatty acid CoA ligase FadD9 [Mycolicibacterium sp. BK556]MBB3630160.1 fatty acid CoA ligase FadD9 [Mycolicibacterium sp. BK607]